VQALVKPTVVGHKRVTFRSWSTAEHHAHSEARASALSEGESDTESEGTSSSSLAGAGLSSATSMMVPTEGWMMITPEMMMATDGESSNAVSGTQSSSSWSRTRSSARSQSAMKGEMHGFSRTVGETEGIEPEYRDLPTSVHSLENVRHLAAKQLRELQTGQGFVSYVGAEGWRGARLVVPRIAEQRVSTERFCDIRLSVFEASPSALAAQDAAAAVAQRERTLKADASRPKPRSPEPDKPAEFRTAAPKRKPKARKKSDDV